MKKYEVKDKAATLGVGMVLALTDKQVDVRKDCLTKTKKGYVVNEPVCFKKGEIIGIVEGNVPKALLTSLQEADTKEKPSNNDGNKNDKQDENNDTQTKSKG